MAEKEAFRSRWDVDFILSEIQAKHQPRTAFIGRTLYCSTCINYYWPCPTMQIIQTYYRDERP